LNFALNHVSDLQKWRKTVFSDEKRFCLQGPDSYRYQWYLPGTAPLMVDQTDQHKKGIMVWGAIAHDYECPLHVFTENVDADLYIHMLALHFFPNVALAFPSGFYFIQDNAPPHRSFDTQCYLYHKKCTVVPWPPYSPDLNVIENMWSLLSAAVYREKQAYDTVRELEAAVIKACDDIPMTQVNKLIDSMRTRLRVTIKRDGGHTDY
jgi:hypothetical protein